jgi:hypothetical protein
VALEEVAEVKARDSGGLEDARDAGKDGVGLAEDRVVPEGLSVGNSGSVLN